MRATRVARRPRIPSKMGTYTRLHSTGAEVRHPHKESKSTVGRVCWPQNTSTLFKPTIEGQEILSKISPLGKTSKVAPWEEKFRLADC